LTKISITENNNVCVACDNLFIHIILFAQWNIGRKATEFSS